MIGIYKITSPTGRIYIGQSIDIYDRWKDYKSQLSKRQPRLNRSFIKHSVESHTFEIIEECSIYQLNEKERYWQDFYNVLKDGLNCRLTSTNDKSGCLSKETKLKVSKNHARPNLGKKHSIESIELMRIANKGRTHMIGKKLSDETKRKIAEASRGRIKSKESISKGAEKRKKIILNKETGIFYFGLKEAAESLNINENSLKSRIYRKSSKCNLIFT